MAIELHDHHFFLVFPFHTFFVWRCNPYGSTNQSPGGLAPGFWLVERLGYHGLHHWFDHAAWPCSKPMRNGGLHKKNGS